MISVVVLVWHSERVIARCLESVISQLDTQDEVIVVDNGSTDQSMDVVARVALEARVVAHARNLGVASGRQSGADVACGDYLLFLDDDAELLPGALSTLRRVLDEDPTAAVAGPATVDGNGARVPSARLFPTLPGKVGALVKLGALGAAYRHERDHFLKSQARTAAPYLIGACQLVRASAFHGIGGLDTRFFYGPEDVDMCLRLWLGGWRCVYEPSAMVVHEPRRMSIAAPFGVAGRRHALALIRFFSKHRYVWRAPMRP